MNEYADKERKDSMKKTKMLLLAIICALSLTGCVRYNTTVTVKQDGNVDISMLVAMVDMSDYGYGIDDIFSEGDFDELEEDIWTVEKYNEGDYSGFILTASDITPEQLAEDLEEMGQYDSSNLSIRQDGDNYIIDLDVSEYSDFEDAGLSKSALATSGGYMTFTLKLPVAAIDSNATTVSDDGKTLEWDLLDVDDGNVHVELY